MTSPLFFHGRVAVITGAGGGLGKTYALLLAKRGAKVVVNDLGGSSSGEGESKNLADKVVSEIKSSGGQAVASYDSVEDGHKIIATAIDNYGRIDILINNAGILRDRSMFKMTEKDWDLVHRVHLRGSFMVTRAAWPYMRKQQFGRIIMTSSASGLYGNFGQANYSAAKMGLVGLSNTLAEEGKKYNIHCNAVAPAAISRMTESILPPQIAEKVDPSLVAPFVAYLCHESCEETKGIFESIGGWSTKVRLQRSLGYANPEATIEDIVDNWDKVCDFTKSDYPNVPGSSTIAALERLSQAKSNSEENSTPTRMNNLSDYVGLTSKSLSYTYDFKDVILYALGIGTKVNHDDHTDLKYLFELHEDFSAIPSIVVIMAQTASGDLISKISGIDFTQLLHGEQYFRIYSPPLPTSGTFQIVATVSEVLDKVKGAMIIVDVDGYDEKMQNKMFTTQFVLFIRGAGGYGGKSKSDKIVSLISVPSRDPDATVEEMVPISLAALYRLSGDYNPLHIDPNFASMGGFKHPILHGLCSYGHAVRHIIMKFCNNDASRLISFKARFTKPVIPGQTIISEMWLDKSQSKVLVQCRVKETGDIIISGAHADIKMGGDVISNSITESNKSQFKAAIIFNEAKKRISSSKQSVASGGTILWTITKDTSSELFTLDLNTKPISIYGGKPVKGNASCTVTISDDDFVQLAAGKMNPRTAFIAGKVKLKGDILLLEKLESLKLFKVDSNL